MTIPASNEQAPAPDLVCLGGKVFRRIITHDEIRDATAVLAGHIHADYRDRERPVFLGVLNGAFMFMAELMQKIDFPCEVSFVKMASYAGTVSDGEVCELVGLTDSLQGRHVVIVEDIVDTGVSIDHLLRLAAAQQPASIAVAALLFKPECYTFDHPVDYYAFSVPNSFVVGFGLDYNRLGRNLKDIYELVR